MAIKFGPLLPGGFYNDESGGGGGGGYTNEQAQDAVGTILTDTAEIDFTYDDATPSITADLKTTAVTPGSYGSATEVATATYDSKGRATAAASVTIAIPSTQVTDFNEAAQDTIGGILADTAEIDLTYSDATPSITADLKTTTVTPGAYGSATQVASSTYDSKGRATAASNIAIAIPSTQVTDFDEAAQDAVGSILTDSTSVDLTYNDVSNQITATVITGTTTQNIGTASGGSADTPSKSDHVHGTPMTTNGDILYYNAGVSRLGIGTQEQVLKNVGGSLAYHYPVNLDYSKYRYIYDDFLGSTAASVHQLGWAYGSSGAGAVGTSGGLFAGCLGVHGAQTGTTTTGRTSMYTAIGILVCGNGELTIEWKASLDTVPNGTESFFAQIGGIDTVSASGESVDGIYFYADQASGNWFAKTSNTSARTSTDTGVAIDTSFHVFKIVANAAGTSVAFYIDGTLVATNTTNIPTSTRTFGYGVKIEKTAGTTNCILYFDYLYSLVVF